MGNRAVILVDGEPEIGIYLHWNGGQESVRAFLDATLERVGSVNIIGLIQTAANFFGYDGMHLYIGPPKTLDQDNGDNGVFHVNRAGEITSREYAPARTLGPLDKKYHADLLETCRKHNPSKAGWYAAEYAAA